MSPETRAQRNRRLRQGWTDEDLRAEEDEAFRKSAGILRLWEAGRAAVDRLTPNQLKRRPRGAPSGSSIVEVAVLEAATDHLSKHRDKFNVTNLARASHYGRGTILNWSKKHPGEYDRLRARWHGVK